MKRLWIVLMLILALVVVGCAQQEQENVPEAITEVATSEETAEETVVVEEIATPEEATTVEETVTEENTVVEEVADTEGLLLTLEELKQYDGQEGRPAYVVVDGIIYDMTDVKAWSGGKHHGNQAGQDLTDVIKNKSPHGVKNLENVPVVGRLVTE